MKKSCYIICAICAICLTFGLVACKDDKTGYGTPIITGVRTVDPTTADSLFTKASPGQVIAVIGENLANVLHAYINDQEVTVNSTMNTDHSIILTVPTEEDGFQLTAFNEDLSNEIRLETSHGTAVYSFLITAPSPSITTLRGDYPREVGDSLWIYGYNLVDIESIYITDISTDSVGNSGSTIGGTHTEITNYSTLTKEHALDSKTSSYITTSVLGCVLPSGIPSSGTLVVETASGTAYIAFYTLPGVPTINSISSEFPEIGETVTIKGTEFVQVSSITYGDVTIDGNDITTNDDNTEMTFTFTQKPTEGSGTTLTLTTPGGTATVENFFNYDCLLVDFDGRGADNGWGPNATYESATSGVIPYSSDGNYARINVTENQQWWGTMVYFHNSWNDDGSYDLFTLPGYDVIPADASTDDVYLAVEVYNNNSDYGNGTFGGYIRYFIQKKDEDPSSDVNQFDNFYWTNYPDEFAFTYTILGDIDGEAPTGKWYRHVLPLSVFGMYSGKTYQDVVEGGINQLRLQSINQSVTKGSIDVMFDNIRIYYQK